MIETAAVLPPVPRTEPEWMEAFEAQRRHLNARPHPVVLIGDSLARQWPTPLPWPGTQEPAAKFAIGGDQTQHILWRLQQLDGHLRGARTIVVFAGTNNAARDPEAQAITSSLLAIIETLHLLAPDAAIALVGILYRGIDFRFRRDFIDGINAVMAGHAAEAGFRFIDVNAAIVAETAGKNPNRLYVDEVHLTTEGYAFIASVIGALPPA